MMNPVSCKFLKMIDVKILFAEDRDIPVVRDFISVHFDGKEPAQTFHVRPEEAMTPFPESILKDCVDNKTLLIAYKGDKPVGVLVAFRGNAGDCEKKKSVISNIGQKTREIFDFYGYIIKKLDIFKRLKVSHCLHVSMLSVHSDHHSEGIGRKLFKFIDEIAKDRKYPAMDADCTSVYSARIAEELGMECLSVVTYDEYNEVVGKKLFAPFGPHTEVKSYVKLFDI
jgi:GNAT superfamily N-acetyltransferase